MRPLSCGRPSGVRYARFLRFSFLILICRFVTLEGMKIKSATPMHHLMIMVSSVSVGLGKGERRSVRGFNKLHRNPQLRDTTADSHKRYGTFRSACYVFKDMENGRWPAWMRVSWATGAFTGKYPQGDRTLKTEGHVRREMAVTLG
jgi:hypothetical protein